LEILQLLQRVLMIKVAGYVDQKEIEPGAGDRYVGCYSTVERTCENREAVYLLSGCEYENTLICWH
jgi:hypothetical protein